MILDDYQVRGSALKVTANLQIASEDLSGGGSSTAQADKGFKPKRLSCRLEIAYKNANDLTDLVGLAQQLNDAGSRHAFRIIHPTANAMQIRQVIFADNFNVKERDTQKGWIVSFTLIEHRSVPERIEERQQLEPVTQQQAPVGNAIDAGGTVDENSPLELTGVEKVLKWADDRLK